MQLSNQQAQLLIQRTLGQILFYPPIVAGWPNGKTWIDRCSLLLRMRLPQLLISTDGIEINFKADDDSEIGLGTKSKRNMNRYKINALIDWKKTFGSLEKIMEKDHFKILSAGFLQTEKLPDQAFMEKFIVKENYDANMAVALLSLPEYQLS